MHLLKLSMKRGYLFFQHKTFHDYRPNFLHLTPPSPPLPPSLPPSKKKRSFWRGGMFFQVLFLINGSSDKIFFFEWTKLLSPLLGHSMFGQSNHASTVSTLEFSKIAKISAILNKFWHFFFHKVILVKHW
jgi:hypothetical protein